MIKHLKYLFFSGIIFFGLAEVTYAFPKTDAEYAALPPYCTVRSREQNTANYASWNNKLGPKNFIHIHHYCSALNHINNSYKQTKPILRMRELNNAIGGLDYMFDHAEPSFILMPEIHLKKGDVFRLLKKYGDAITEYHQSIQIKADYIPPYRKIADIYIELGDKKSAIDILQKGLKQKPNSKSLKRRLKSLTK